MPRSNRNPLPSADSHMLRFEIRRLGGGAVTGADAEIENRLVHRSSPDLLTSFGQQHVRRFRDGPADTASAVREDLKGRVS